MSAEKRKTTSPNYSCKNKQSPGLAGYTSPMWRKCLPQDPEAMILRAWHKNPNYFGRLAQDGGLKLGILNGIMENKMETIIIGYIEGYILGLLKDNGKQNGNYSNYPPKKIS